MAAFKPGHKCTRARRTRFGPIGATSVKRAYEPGPVTTRAAGLGLTILLDSFLAGARVFSPRGQGSGWSARSRAAARTNELHAGERRKIIGGGEGGRLRLACQGRVLVPGAWLAEWSRKMRSTGQQASDLEHGMRIGAM